MLSQTLYACIWDIDNGYTINPNKRKEFFKALKDLDDKLITVKREFIGPKEN